MTARENTSKMKAPALLVALAMVFTQVLGGGVLTPQAYAEAVAVLGENGQQIAVVKVNEVGEVTSIVEADEAEVSSFYDALISDNRALSAVTISSVEASDSTSSQAVATSNFTDESTANADDETEANPDPNFDLAELVVSIILWVLDLSDSESSAFQEVADEMSKQ